MKGGNTKHANASEGMACKQEKDLQQLLKIADDAELKKLLGVNLTNSSTTDINTLRMMWKKEKNRIAAKKSREKKANLMVELEKKEIHLANEVEDLRRFVMEYDTVVESLLRYIKYTLNADWAAQAENGLNRSGPARIMEGSREVYRKLACCLEYFYHIRNSENSVVPYVSSAVPSKLDASNRLIDEIIFSIKNSYCGPDKK